MTPYVELDGVRNWYDERGGGDPLVLMHGGVVDSRFYEQTAALPEQAAVEAVGPSE